MQSGTILHLALLRKLSTNSPTCNYTRKFTHFRNNIRNRSPHLPSFTPSFDTFRKYSSQEEHSHPTCKTSRSNRPLKHSRFRTKGREQRENICGWSIANQQTFDYLLKVKQKETNKSIKHNENNDLEKENSCLLRGKLQNHQIRRNKTRIRQIACNEGQISTDNATFIVSKTGPLGIINLQNQSSQPPLSFRGKTKQFKRTPRQFFSDLPVAILG